MNEEEYTEIADYEGFHIEDDLLTVIVPTEETELDADFFEQHDKHAYMQVNDVCPNPACRKPTLEYQIFGTEKEIFCTSCDYHETVQI